MHLDHRNPSNILFPILKKYIVITKRESLSLSFLSISNLKTYASIKRPLPRTNNAISEQYSRQGRSVSYYQRKESDRGFALLFVASRGALVSLVAASRYSMSFECSSGVVRWGEGLIMAMRLRRVRSRSTRPNRCQVGVAV